MKNFRHSIVFSIIVILFARMASSQTVIENECLWDITLLNTGVNATYMTVKEKEMILEINKVRTNPKKYTLYLFSYLEEAKKNFRLYGKGQKNYALRTSFISKAGKQVPVYDTIWYFTYEEEVRALESLIQELDESPYLSILKPDRGIYSAALRHAKDQKPTGQVVHIGTDGSWPLERITYASPKMEYGNENIACGNDDAREILIQLLIDSGIVGYGHRKNILDSQWTHCACLWVGVINQEFNCTYWIQEFGKKKQ